MTTVHAGPAVRPIALAGAVLMLVVVIASAYLRLATRPPACPDAGDCAPTIITFAADGPSIAVARFAHRVAASGVGLVLIAALVAAIRQRPRDLRLLGYAFASIALVTVLALVGARSAEAPPGTRAAGTAFVNAVGGLVLLGLIWRLTAVRSGRPDADSPRATLAARAALVATLAFIAWDAGVATGLPVPGFANWLDANELGSAWLVLAVIASSGAATSLLRRGRAAHGSATMRLGASIAVLALAAVALRAITAQGPGIAPRLASTAINALLLCALVTASASRAKRAGAPAPAC